MESALLNCAVLVSVKTKKLFLERQSRSAAKHTSGTRNSRGLTGNVGHSRAARCFRIVKFFLSIQSIHLALHVEGSSFFFEHKVHLLSTVELFPSLHDQFSIIPQFPCNLLRDSLDKVNFSSSIVRTFCGFLFELDKPTGLHDATLIIVIHFDC